MRIAIASGKGGTGKTTLAVNLASLLAERQEVVLVDLDVEEPNSKLFLGGELLSKEDRFKQVPVWQAEKCIFCGRCQEVCHFQAIIKIPQLVMVFPRLCHSCYACSELCPKGALPMQGEKMGELRHWRIGALEFIESRLDIGQEQAVPLIRQTLLRVEEKFGKERLYLLDSPPGTSCPVLEVTRDADYVILVTEPTPFGLHDLSLAVETMEHLGKRFGVVINRDGTGDDRVLEYCRTKGIRVLGKIANDRQIAELYSRGELLYKVHPAFRAALEQISSSVFSELQEVSR